MEYLGLSWLTPYVPQIITGLWGTLILSAISCLLGALIGIVTGLARNNGGRWIRFIAAVYVESVRNTPLLAQAFLCYFGLASLGLKLNPMQGAALALTLNCGAYCAEIFRAGYASMNATQYEAAESLALSKVQTFVHVILPQATRKVWVALSGQFVLIILASSVVSQISADELTSAASQVQSMTFRSFDVYILLAVGYMAIATLIKLGLFYIGRHAFRDAAVTKVSVSPQAAGVLGVQK